MENPPCVLGFYVLADRLLHPRFVPVGVSDHHHMEINPMLSLASSQFEVWQDVHVTIWDCRNGKLLVEIGDKLEVRSYLTRPCSIAAYPQSPLRVILNRSFTYQHHEFLPDDGGDGHEYYRLALGYKDGCIIACLSLLCGHIWVNRNSEVVDLPKHATSSDFAVPFGKLGNRKVYLVTTSYLVIILDIDTMKMVMVQVPDDLVEECYDFDLCPVSNFEFHLFGLSQSNLHVWCHSVTGSNQWKPLHCIPVQDMFSDMMSPRSEQIYSWDELTLWGVGEQAEFVLLKADSSVYQFNIKAKKLTKVFQMHPEDGELEKIFPCMMIWPPIFSSTRDYNTNNRPVRLRNMAAETISPETDQSKVKQSHGVQKHTAVTLNYAARARRKLINSQEEEYAFATMTTDADLII
ncbi:hypothetical protein BS78_05G009900 [Paspalum vaginatum]|nr:hypothetical protein BS78_05G009900 [Paspalum vaginatum]